ncbi:MAG: SCP2 sterol-binding domain-containing protein [Gammaproteobacteria bacterium]|nr:SCP2 sterol-binding domain-containing protein [Gammaproteobacteria bacterium]
MVGKKESTTSYNLAYEVFVQGLAGEPENKDFVSRHNRAIQFNIEGEESFIVDVQDGNVDVRKGVLDDPDLAVVANPDVFRQVFRGRSSPCEAWMDDQWWVGGAFSDYVGTSWLMRLIKRGVSSRMKQVFQ